MKAFAAAVGSGALPSLKEVCVDDNIETKLKLPDLYRGIHIKRWFPPNFIHNIAFNNL